MQRSSTARRGFAGSRKGDAEGAIRRRHGRWLEGACVVFMSLGSQGCEAESCNGLLAGKTYSFELKEEGPFGRERAPAVPPCTDPGDLNVGDSVSIRVLAEYEDDAMGCKRASGELASEPPLSRRHDVSLLRESPMTEEVINASAAVDWDGCPADWAISVAVVYDENALGEYRSGDPNVVLYRGFYPHSVRDDRFATVCEGKSACADRWGVHVTEAR
jgi:hypothetical protein